MKRVLVSPTGRIRLPTLPTFSTLPESGSSGRGVEGRVVCLFTPPPLHEVQQAKGHPRNFLGGREMRCQTGPVQLFQASTGE